MQSPKVDSPPLNHIGLWVDNLEAAVKHLTAAGVRFTPGGIRKGAAGHNVVFIHPKVLCSCRDRVDATAAVSARGCSDTHKRCCIVVVLVSPLRGCG